MRFQPARFGLHDDAGTGSGGGIGHAVLAQRLVGELL
jgi:hypothetical protein